VGPVVKTDIKGLLAERAGESFGLHEQFLNTQMVRVLKTIGFDRRYVRAEGPYLFDDEGQRYLDLLSGWGVFALGRNHPNVVAAIKETLDLSLPNLVQMDVSLLSGLLAERILKTLPDSLDKMFFCSSGTEAAEAAIKFARYATRRPGILYCEHGFHGLTMGAVSLNGQDIFQEGFGPLLPECRRVPFNDLEALEAALAKNDVAAFFVEPIQGHGAFMPSPDYLREAGALCRRYGTLFVVDEIQTGVGRTGKMWAFEHFGAEPDLVLMAKALSGGFIPVGAVALRKAVFDKVFSNMVRAPIHGSTFSKNNLAMAAGIATLDVIEQDGLVAKAARMGQALLQDLKAIEGEFELVKDTRGLGLMLAIEFGNPKSLKLKAAFKLVEAANKGLFCQMVTIPLFKKHRVLSQTAAHGQNVIKFLPPLVIDESDRKWLIDALRDVVAEAHKVPGSVWDLGKTLAGHAMKNRREAANA
jgi:ornithine--oxo-acid transaminase